jgi:hypothetical protein
VDVIDQDDQRAPVVEELDEPPSRPERLLDRVGSRREADRARQPIDDVAGIRAQQVHELLERLGGGVVVPDPGHGSNDLRQRPEREAFPVRETSASNRARSGSRHELLEQSGLPRPCGSGHRDDLTDA